MPLVGDADRSRSGEILPWVGDMARARAARSLSPPSIDESCSEGGANFWESSVGRCDRPLARDSASPPETDVLEEKRLLIVALPRTEPAREPGELERMLSAGGFFLKAADPLPPSADCRKKFGSLAPNDAAMELLDGLASGEDGGSGVLLAEARSGEREATDKGRRMLPDLGLWFHDNVPERPNAAALVAGFLGSVSSRVAVVGELVRRCSDSSRPVS